MFILLNGSFGIGKTTAAMDLVRVLPDAAMADPEAVGFVLRRLPPWLLGLARQPGDYQDIALWRRLIVLQARWVHRRAGIVVVPMAFTNRAYLAGFRDSLRRTAPVHTVCLLAPPAVVRARLAARALAGGRHDLSDFEFRRSAECVSAHGDPFFGVPVDATADPGEVVAQIRRALAC